LTASQLVDLTLDLRIAESDMASGDLYSWTYGTIRAIQAPYKREIPEIGPPKVAGVELFAAFSYKQDTF